MRPLQQQPFAHETRRAPMPTLGFNGSVITVGVVAILCVVAMALLSSVV